MIKPGSVLLIDDEPVVRQTIDLILRRAGIRCYAVSDAATGLAAAATLLPDVIVCDAVLPRLSGPELVLQLRAQPLTAEIPVVLTSGFPMGYFAPNGTASGRKISFLQKPFSPAQLLNAFDEVLSEGACSSG